jgi:hypothetical protein
LVGDRRALGNGDRIDFEIVTWPFFRSPGSKAPAAAKAG